MRQRRFTLLDLPAHNYIISVHTMSVYTIYMTRASKRGKREGELDSRWESKAADAIVMAAALDV